jgi:hypothetical protein
MEKADELLKKAMPETEGHPIDELFIEIVEIMEEYANQFKQRSLNKQQLRAKFFKECVDINKVNLAPHDLFEWFWREFDK